MPHGCASPRLCARSHTHEFPKPGTLAAKQRAKEGSLTPSQVLEIERAAHMRMLNGEAEAARATYASLRATAATKSKPGGAEAGYRLHCRAIAAIAADTGDAAAGLEPQRALTRALNPLPADTQPLSDTQRWVSSYLLAVLHQRGGSTDEAVAQFRECLGFDAAAMPEGAAAFCSTGLAGCLQQMGSSREALEACEAAARLGASSSLLFTHATLLAQIGDSARAERMLGRLLVVQPDHREAALALALLRAHGGRLAAARQTVDAVLRQQPSHAAALQLRGWLRMRAAGKSAVELARALADYAGALELAPDAQPAEAHTAVGWLHQLAGRGAEARDAFRRAKHADGASPLPALYLAHALRQQEARENAPPQHAHGSGAAAAVAARGEAQRVDGRADAQRSFSQAAARLARQLPELCTVASASAELQRELWGTDAMSRRRSSLSSDRSATTTAQGDREGAFSLAASESPAYEPPRWPPARCELVLLLVDCVASLAILSHEDGDAPRALALYDVGLALCAHLQALPQQPPPPAADAPPSSAQPPPPPGGTLTRLASFAPTMFATVDASAYDEAAAGAAAGAATGASAAAGGDGEGLPSTLAEQAALHTAQIHLNRGRLRAALGERDEAAQDLRAAVSSFDHAAQEEAGGRHRMQAAGARCDLGAVCEAIAADLSAAPAPAATASPPAPSQHDPLGYYKQAARLDPTCAMARASGGTWLLRAQGDAAAALPELSAALGVDPSNLAARCNRAAAYRAQGNAQAARHDYELAVRQHAAPLASFNLAQLLLDDEAEWPRGLAMLRALHRQMTKDEAARGAAVGNGAGGAIGGGAIGGSGGGVGSAVAAEEAAGLASQVDRLLEACERWESSLRMAHADLAEAAAVLVPEVPEVTLETAAHESQVEAAADSAQLLTPWQQQQLETALAAATDSQAPTPTPLRRGSSRKSLARQADGASPGTSPLLRRGSSSSAAAGPQLPMGVSATPLRRALALTVAAAAAAAAAETDDTAATAKSVGAAADAADAADGAGLPLEPLAEAETLLGDALRPLEGSASSASPQVARPDGVAALLMLWRSRLRAKGGKLDAALKDAQAAAALAAASEANAAADQGGSQAGAADGAAAAAATPEADILLASQLRLAAALEAEGSEAAAVPLVLAAYEAALSRQPRSAAAAANVARLRLSLSDVLGAARACVQVAHASLEPPQPPAAAAQAGEPPPRAGPGGAPRTRLQKAKEALVAEAAAYLRLLLGFRQGDEATGGEGGDGAAAGAGEGGDAAAAAEPKRALSPIDRALGDRYEVKLARQQGRLALAMQRARQARVALAEPIVYSLHASRRNFMSRLWARHGELLGLASAPERLLSASDALTQQLLDDVQRGVSKLGGQLPTTEALVGSMAAQEAQAAAPARRAPLRRTSAQAPSP